MRIASATLSAEQQHTGKADANLHQDRSFDLRSQPNDGNESPRSGPKPPARAPALRIHLSQDKLRKHLPLSEGAALKLPILLHGPEVGSDMLHAGLQGQQNTLPRQRDPLSHPVIRFRV